MIMQLMKQLGVGALISWRKEIAGGSVFELQHHQVGHFGVVRRLAAMNDLNA